MLPPVQLGRMAEYRQFIVVRFTPDPTRPGKTIKQPVDPVGGWFVDHLDPKNQTTAAEAYAAAERLGVTAGEGGVWHGVGFVFTEADPFFFIDIDECALEGGQWSPVAVELCTRFAGALVEVSQSGRGLHIFGTYSGACPEHSCKPSGTGLELYHWGRFAALGYTDRGAGDAATDHTETLAQVIAQYFPPGVTGGGVTEWSTEAPEDYDGPADDAELLERAFKVRPSTAAIFGGKATFAQVFAGDVDALTRSFPPQKSDAAFDASSADASLFQHLAYWTGNNCERMERLARMSGLVRDKWERRDYIERSILAATSRQIDYPRKQEKPAAAVKEAAAMAAAAVAQQGQEPGAGLWVFLHEIPQVFAGWVYVQSLHAAVSPSGDVLKPEAFRTLFGGHKWVIDSEGKTERDAWAAFTQCEGWRAPYTRSTCFRPDMPDRRVVSLEGAEYVNTYRPADVLRRQGDASRFLDLLARLLPAERDRTILLSYMAAVVQKIGHKFQWWPVLQGVEGNGKSALARCVAYAVGHRYSFFPNVDDIARNGVKFNGWVEGNLFLSLEEVYVPHRRDFLEAFKTTVTNSRVPVERKGVDARDGDNFANGMLFTNHRDGVPIDLDTRRYAPFFTAQQTKQDLTRDGMTGEYFPRLYAWLRGTGEFAELGQDYGFSVVAEYLARFPIPAEFDPSYLCSTAPTTGSTSEARELSRGTVEQEIIEQAEQGAPGFAGGWISSIAVDRLLDRLNMAGRVPRQKRREMLRALGYVPHPGLPDGRCNVVVMPDGGKPRLYVKADHLALQLYDPPSILRAYQTAQGMAPAAQARA